MAFAKTVRGRGQGRAKFAKERFVPQWTVPVTRTVAEQDEGEHVEQDFRPVHVLSGFVDRDVEWCS